MRRRYLAQQQELSTSKPTKIKAMVSSNQKVLSDKQRKEENSQNNLDAKVSSKNANKNESNLKSTVSRVESGQSSELVQQDPKSKTEVIDVQDSIRSADTVSQSCKQSEQSELVGIVQANELMGKYSQSLNTRSNETIKTVTKQYNRNKFTLKQSGYEFRKQYKLSKS